MHGVTCGFDNKDAFSAAEKFRANAIVNAVDDLRSLVSCNFLAVQVLDALNLRTDDVSGHLVMFHAKDPR